MAKELFIDTNVLLKVFFREKNFQPVLEVLELIEKNEITGYLSTVTISEIVTIFGRKKQYVDLENTLSWLSKTFENVSASTEIAILAGHLKARYASNKSPLSFADSIIAASSILYDAPLITFDAEFNKIKELVIILPSEILQ